MLTTDTINSATIGTLLQSLKPDNSARWGLMSPQHMVEHLAQVTSLSNGNTQALLLTPHEQLELYRQKGLFSDRAWFQNTKSPMLDPENLQPLEYKTLDEAKEALLQEIDQFHAYFKENPHATPVNAVFGELSYDGWKQFHYKHFRHHFVQFGLMESEAYSLTEAK
jgi:oxepin-CoA hydrolase / 3-oxo-5,6-dehydrosuberyl-CoA semialdehyde dehydrogenase